jgi:hypothetical protein
MPRFRGTWAEFGGTRLEQSSAPATKARVRKKAYDENPKPVDSHVCVNARLRA